MNKWDPKLDKRSPKTSKKIHFFKMPIANMQDSQMPKELIKEIVDLQLSQAVQYSRTYLRRLAE